jgi:hypothetical protein
MCHHHKPALKVQRIALYLVAALFVALSYWP